jgi:hypothetical protein
MTESDLITALGPVCQILERLGVRYYLAGSVASSAHGVARASLDADIVTELQPEHSEALTAALAESYYIPTDRVRAAISERRSFNLIHLATMFKIDVFVSRGRAFDRRAAERARRHPLGETAGALEVPTASREDTVLAKLERFGVGAEVSERQWWDIIGMLKVGARIDGEYLQHWAQALGVADLLERALNEAS